MKEQNRRSVPPYSSFMQRMSTNQYGNLINLETRIILKYTHEIAEYDK